MGEDAVVYNLQPSKLTERKYCDLTIPERKAALILMNEEIELIKLPEIKGIKQVELFIKWQKIVRSQLRDITCPKPLKEILRKLQNKAKETKKTK